MQEPTLDDDDLEWLERERDPAFLASIAEARRQVEQGRTTSHADLKRQLGLDGGPVGSE